LPAEREGVKKMKKYTTKDFDGEFPNDEACLEWIKNHRYPNGIHCPICDKKMEKITVGEGQPALLLDRCSKGDGLWFDRGELNNIIEKAKLDEGNKIKRLLGDMFGKGKS
jgi:hypothetical protein